MATAKIYDGSSWVSGIFKVWDGSAWQAKMKFWDGSAWVDLGLLVDMSPELLFNTTTSGTCRANLKLDNDGSVYRSSAGGAYGSASQVWLDAGSNSDVWVSRTIESGSLDTDDIGTGRVAMTADRVVGVQTTTGTKSCSLTLSFWDAPSGGNLLDTAGVDLTAEVSIN